VANAWTGSFNSWIKAASFFNTNSNAMQGRRETTHIFPFDELRAGKLFLPPPPHPLHPLLMEPRRECKWTGDRQMSDGGSGRHPDRLRRSRLRFVLRFRDFLGFRLRIRDRCGGGRGCAQMLWWGWVANRSIGRRRGVSGSRARKAGRNGGGGFGCGGGRRSACAA